MKTAVFEVLKNPEDYRQRAQIMWGGSVAHWGLTGCGVHDDWATHQLEHELSGMFDVTPDGELKNAAGWMMTVPTVSPEHGPRGKGTNVTAGSTMDNRVVSRRR